MTISSGPGGYSLSLSGISSYHPGVMILCHDIGTNRVKKKSAFVQKSFDRVRESLAQHVSFNFLKRYSANYLLYSLSQYVVHCIRVGQLNDRQAL